MNRHGADRNDHRRQSLAHFQQYREQLHTELHKLRRGLRNAAHQLEVRISDRRTLQAKGGGDGRVGHLASMDVDAVP